MTSNACCPFCGCASNQRRNDASPPRFSSASTVCGSSRRYEMLERAVARVRADRAHHLGPLHRQHHRAVAARRLADDGARLALGNRAQRAVDEGHQLVAQVALVAPDRRRVDVLRAAVAGEAVGRDHDRLAHCAGAHRRAEPLGQRRLPRRAVERELPAVAAEAGEEQHHRIAPRRRRVVRRRQHHHHVAPRRIAERVVRQQLRLVRQHLYAHRRMVT